MTSRRPGESEEKFRQRRTRESGITSTRSGGGADVAGAAAELIETAGEACSAHTPAHDPGPTSSPDTSSPSY